MDSATARPRLWIEPCAGSAAVALRLVGGPYANPPIGYMGGKRGYARAILGVLGLRQGQGADEVWLADAGPWAAVWRVLTAPGGAEAVAAVIRAWEGEEPRALWERLRAQGWGELTTPEEVGAWVYVRHKSAFSADPEVSHDTGGPSSFDVLNGDGNGKAVGPVASRVSAVARWLVAQFWSFSGKGPEKGYGGPGCPGGDWGQEARDEALSLPKFADGVSSRSMPVPVRVWSDARAIPIPDDCEGVYVYIDPPYVGTTGYAHDLPRADVLDLARRWDAAGATVCVSEAVPLDLPGWFHVRIDGERIGQKRTFSKQKTEWLTVNREPVWRPVVGQVALFEEVA